MQLPGAVVLNHFWAECQAPGASVPWRVLGSSFQSFDMNSIVKQATALLLLLSLVSCSFTKPSKQELRIVTNEPEAVIIVNGRPIGKGEAVTKVKTNDTVSVAASLGFKRDFTKVEPTLSTMGILDTVGGCFCIIPFIGLFSGGAWKFEEDEVYLYLY